MKFVSRGFLAAVITCSCGCSSAAAPSSDDGNKLGSDSEFSIRFRSFSVPVKRIILLRVKANFCALRINESGIDDAGGTPIQYANYELFHAKSRNSPPEARKVESGRLDYKGYRGLGHWSWERGNTVLKCGNHRIGWSHPNEFALLGKGEFAVAPTAWTGFSEIRFDDPQLQWFAEDETRKRGELTIHVRSLPGFVPAVREPEVRSDTQTPRR